jgi:hypothetical protein
MRQPGSSAQHDRSCPVGEEARVGLTDAGQARYREILGALDQITTRLVEAADKLLVGPGKVKTAALMPVFLPGGPPPAAIASAPV